MKLKLIDVLELSAEINGVPDKIPGLLREEIDYSVKANIDRVNNLIKPDVESYQRLYKEIWEKHGETKGGRILVKPESKEALYKDIEALNNVEKDVNISGLFSVEIGEETLESMGKTKGWYPLFRALLEDLKPKEEEKKTPEKTTKLTKK